MKQTGLWSRLNRRHRAALHERMGERGAAMMLAVLFVISCHLYSSISSIWKSGTETESSL